MAGHPLPTDSRYRFRLFSPDDLGELRQFYQHPEAVRFLTAHGAPWDDEQILDAVERWKCDYQRTGYTKWRVDRTDGSFVGRAGLSPLEDSCEGAEIGFWVMPDLWGQGLATELANIVCCWTWENTSLDGVFGITMPGNEASRRVLQKLGMIETEQRDYLSVSCQFHWLPRPELRSIEPIREAP